MTIKTLLIASATGLLSTGMFAQDIRPSGKSIMTENPFLTEYTTPFKVPPFDKIRMEHFKPAMLEGIKQNEKEIQAIVKNKQKPTFANTIVAMEDAGDLLSKVSTVFYNLNSANTNDEIQALAKEMAPVFSAHRDNIMLNDALFKRVKTVYDNRSKEKLTSEDQRLLEETYKRFVRSGANLSAADKEKLRKLNEQLSLLTLTFGQNILAETNAYELVISDKADLAGLPQEVISTAAATAKQRGKDGNWVFTLSNSSYMPFIQYSDKRNLRKEIWNAYVNRANNGNAQDNNKVAIDLANLRLEKAKLLGYASHADYALEETMAKSPAKVMTFLQELWTPTLVKAKQEEAEIKSLMNASGVAGEVMPYDWSYYAEKIRQQKFDLDEQALKPYFSIDNVTQGVFMVCNRLFGLTFEQVKNAPVYHPEATLWEVKEANGTTLGVLYMDFHPRASKRGGAWMTSYRPQQTDKKGNRELPVISIVCNFSKPTENAPALFTFDETLTYFHEFGHALHGLLSDVKYQSLAGTSVSRDFVELPSQVMENWASDPAVLKMYAKHYQTGEAIPDALIAKLENAGTYGQGFATMEYLASSFLDMSFHTITEPITSTSAHSFEVAAMKELGLISSILPRHRSTYFSHIFAGGYSAGYYSYIWAGVLDTDAFDQFKQTDLFDQTKATSFRKNVLERGGTEDPMQLYIKFRGQEPTVDALLKKRGLDQVSN